MAVTLTQVQLSAAIRLGDSAEEVAEATRLLAFTSPKRSHGTLATPTTPRPRPLSMKLQSA